MVMIIKHGASQKEIRKALKEMQNRTNKGGDVKKYVGKIKLKENVLELQKKLRDEWE